MGERVQTFRKYQNPYYIYYPEGDYWEKMTPDPKKTALLIIDIQKQALDVAKELKKKGSGYLYDRLVNVTIPNAKRLLEFFRENKLAVAFAAIGSQRSDGRDRSPVQSRPGWNFFLLKIGTRDAEIVDELKPREDEIVVYKTTDSALNGTPIGHIFRWMGIEYVVVAGIYTDQCVSGTVRDLADWGFTVFLVEDATAALTPEIHEHELRVLNQIYCKVVSTNEIIDSLGHALRSPR